MKLSLDKTWSECIRMWEWIVEAEIILENYCVPINIENLKLLYVTANGMEDYQLSQNCYFCEYAKSGGLNSKECRTKCPGRLVDDTFCCDNPEYAYCENPEDFLAELERLNSIRLQRKSKKGK